MAVSPDRGRSAAAQARDTLRGARDKGESARTRMMVSAYASRLRLTLATATADHGTELDAALEVPGLIALDSVQLGATRSRFCRTLAPVSVR